MSKHNLQYEIKNDNKLKVIEQDIIEIKDELHVAVSQNLNSVAERVLYTREAKDDIEIEQFNLPTTTIKPVKFSYPTQKLHWMYSTVVTIKLFEFYVVFCFTSIQYSLCNTI